jgi:DNA-directed RNA polymerase specialized sigma24 family protein
MESIKLLNIGQLENNETLKSKQGSQVTNDRAIYDELIAPMESRMIRSIWRAVRHSDLAEDTLQDALSIIWKKRFQIRLHPNPPALILRIYLRK